MVKGGYSEMAFSEEGRDKPHGCPGRGSNGDATEDGKRDQGGSSPEGLAGHWPCTGHWTLGGVESHGFEQKRRVWGSGGLSHSLYFVHRFHDK